MNSIDTSVAVSSRIRLARNLSGVNFPCMIHGTEHEKIVSLRCEEILKKFGGFTFYPINQLSIEERQSFVERYLISNNLANNEGGVLAVCQNEYLSVMINEEDHLREQCIMRGLDLYTAYRKAARLDRLLGANLPFAQRGGVYYTACPSNLGTGLRASVMLFLPAITDNGRFKEICGNARQYGLTIRGRFGEGSNNESYLCQVSNEITYGITEEEILELVNGFVEDTISLEQELRHENYAINKDFVQDKVLRSLGVLRNCLMLSYAEFVNLICMVKLGISLGFLSSNFDCGIDDLLITANKSTLLVNNNSSGDTEEKLRAKFVENALNKLNVCKKY